MSKRQGWEVRGCFPGQFPRIQISSTLIPASKYPVAFHAYRETYKFLIVAKALYPVTHKLSLLVSCTFPGSLPLEVVVHHSQTGRWEVGSGRGRALQELLGTPMEVVLGQP